MIVHYPYLVFAILLLWAPRNWLRQGLRKKDKSARRTADSPVDRDPHDRGVRLRTEVAKSRNWLDFFRALVGAFVVVRMAFQAPEGAGGVHQLTLIAQGGVLLVGMLIQMFRFEGRLSLFASIFFLQGMSVAVAGGLAGFLAMAGTWALTPVLPGAGAVLFVQGGVILSLGLLLGDVEPVTLFVLTGVIWVPVLLSILLRKRLSASFDKRVKVVSREARAKAGVEPVAAGKGEV